MKKGIILFTLLLAALILAVPACERKALYDVANNTYLGTISFSPEPGAYYEDINVALAENTGEVTIRYTTDGSDPTVDSREFTSGDSIPVSGIGTTMQIKAIAVKNNRKYSKIFESKYVVISSTQVTEPEFNYSSGTYGDGINLEMATYTPEAEIYYTTNGSTPAPGISGTTKYTTALLLNTHNETTRVRAIAVKTGMIASTITAGDYTIDYLASFKEKLVAWFPFDEGDINDESGNDIFTVKYGASPGDDIHDAKNAIDFDDGNYINITGITDGAIFQEGFTISAFIYLDTIKSGKNIIFSRHKNGETEENLCFEFYVAGRGSDRGNLQFRVNSLGGFQTATGSTELAAGTWYHVVGMVTYDSESGESGESKISMYCDLNPDGTTATLSSQKAEVTTPVMLGYQIISNGGTEFTTSDFDGRMDEVRIFNNALLDNELERLYKTDNR
ncbi:MAG: hypothetical protein GY754_05975 [bacterium]|nr:hypothetical protein [bacterium]